MRRSPGRRWPASRSPGSTTSPSIESPPLFLGIAARALRAAGLPYVFHVADPWPDFPIAMGYLQSGLERRLAFGLEDFAYRGAAAITTVSPGLVDLLSAKRSAAGRVEHVPNGVDVARFDSRLTPADARRQLGWDEAFTIVYAGTVGLAQGVGSLLEAAHLVTSERADPHRRRGRGEARRSWPGRGSWASGM